MNEKSFCLLVGAFFLDKSAILSECKVYIHEQLDELCLINSWHGYCLTTSLTLQRNLTRQNVTN